MVKDFIEGNTFLPISVWMGDKSSNESDGCRGDGVHRREHVPTYFWLPFRRMSPTIAVVKVFIEGYAFLPISVWMDANSSNEFDGCRGEGVYRKEHVPHHCGLDGCQFVDWVRRFPW